MCAGTPYIPGRSVVIILHYALYGTRIIRRRAFTRTSMISYSEQIPEEAMAQDNGGTDGGKDGEVRPANWPVPVILLCLREWNSYGYELMERAHAFGFGSMSAPTAYRALRRMEENGVIESSWEASGDGPARRMYTITDAGLAYLDFWAECLDNYRRTTDAFLRAYASSAKRPADNEEESYITS